MTIKTVCALTLKQDAISSSYIDYEAYPLASVFANSKREAIVLYINKILNKYLEVQECFLMEITLDNKDTLKFYKVKGQNIMSNTVFEQDYLILDTTFIEN